MSTKTELVENIIELVNVAYQSDYSAQSVALVAQELRNQLESLDDGGEQTGLSQVELDQLNQYLSQTREKLIQVAFDTDKAKQENQKEEKQSSGGRTDITKTHAVDHSLGAGKAAVGIRREDDAPDGKNK